MVVHGDDFTFLEYEEELDYMEKKMGEWYDIKVRGRVGDNHEDAKAIAILNRKLVWDGEKLVYTADTKHADKIMEDMGIEVGSKPLNCPAMRPDEENDESDEVELSRCEAKDFRRLGMTANYLAMDRQDLQFAVNQICREMSIPKVTGLRKLKKLAR